MSISRILGTVFLIFSCGVSAAGFDCTKASNQTEKTICSDPELSQLDEQLSNQFKKLAVSAKDSKTLIREQRRWITEVRNKCADAPCLARSYRSRINQLDREFNREVFTCPITETTILGGWQGIGASDFEEMAFELNEKKRAFASWRHHRLEMIGRWELRNCELHIHDPENTKLSFDFRVKEYANNALHLQEIDSNVVSKYRKIK